MTASSAANAEVTEVKQRLTFFSCNYPCSSVAISAIHILCKRHI